MKLKITILFLIGFHLAIAQSIDEKVAEANKAYEQGHLAEAHQKFTAIIGENPSLEVQYKLARLELLSNRFQKAESYLEAILDNLPNDSLASKLLAETLYRQDKYERLPDLLEAAGSVEKIQQIQHFIDGNRTPYLIRKDAKKVTISMETVDLLPSVLMKVNGKEGLFIIDTGGGVTILDTDFAKEVGAISFNQKESVYAGGAKAKTTLGFVEKVMLGKLEIENIPVHIQPTKQYAQAVGGKAVLGIIGTNLLYHFVASLDYLEGQLVLQKKGTEVKKKKATQIQMWLAADHLILAKGKIEDSEDQLFLVDTGMAGAGFTAPKSTIDAANIELLTSAQTEGQGAGGAVSITPFMISKLSLGELTNANQIVGLYGPFPPTLEHSLGFRLGGLISHSFFKPYNITFDFEKMIIYAEK